MNENQYSPATPRLLTREEYEERLKNMRTLDDVMAFAKDLAAPLLQTMLDAEDAAHRDLQHRKRHPRTGQRNSRNATSGKSDKTNAEPQQRPIPGDQGAAIPSRPSRK